MPIYPTNPNNLHDEVYHGKKDAVPPLTSIIGIAGDDTPTVDWEAEYHTLEALDTFHKNRIDALAAENTQLRSCIIGMLLEKYKEA